MLNSFCRAKLATGLFALASLTVSFAARAQDVKAVSPFERAMSHVDLAVAGAGEFSETTHGTNYLGQSETLQPSNTLGYLISIRVNTKRPLLGFELNYGYARFSQNFTLGASTLPGNASASVPAVFYGVQSNAKEYSFGYVAHAPHKYFGVTPYAGVGFGTLKNTPTTAGGEGFKQQYRALYYYHLGVESYVLGDHLGLRAGFRQQFYNAPDFLTNYVTDHQRTITSQPVVGVFLRF